MIPYFEKRPVQCGAGNKVYCTLFFKLYLTYYLTSIFTEFDTIAIVVIVIT